MTLTVLNKKILRALQPLVVLDVLQRGAFLLKLAMQLAGDMFSAAAKVSALCDATASLAMACALAIGRVGVWT